MLNPIAFNLHAVVNLSHMKLVLIHGQVIYKPPLAVYG